MISTQAQAVIILATWSVLLAMYAVHRFASRIRFLKAPIVVDLNGVSASRPGSLLSGSGVLFVFVTNIATVGLVLASALSSSVESRLAFLQLKLPLWVQIAGSLLFVLYSLWGLAVLFYNPNYSPLYKHLQGQYVIVTEGPYRLVRHPRYGAEALANLIFCLFTGYWLPLLGILGWAGIYAQARAEERFLLILAPQAYGAYRRRTGIFFPRAHSPSGPG